MLFRNFRNRNEQTGFFLIYDLGGFLLTRTAYKIMTKEYLFRNNEIGQVQHNIEVNMLDICEVAIPSMLLIKTGIISFALPSIPSSLMSFTLLCAAATGFSITKTFGDKEYDRHTNRPYRPFKPEAKKAAILSAAIHGAALGVVLYGVSKALDVVCNSISSAMSR